MVYKYDVFEGVRSEWPKIATPPMIEHFVNDRDIFLRLLISECTDKCLVINDKGEYYTLYGDIIVDNMQKEKRYKTKKILFKSECYDDLTPFDVQILQILNKSVILNEDMINNKENDKLLREKLCEKYYKFPIKKDYESLGT